MITADVEKLKNDYLTVNDGDIEAALLAACQKLLEAAEHMTALECASSHGFLRGHLNREVRTKNQPDEAG